MRRCCVKSNANWWRSKGSIGSRFIVVAFADECKRCKIHGIEIDPEKLQIGGDETRATRITRRNRNQAKMLQHVLVCNSRGTRQNIPVPGINDLCRQELTRAK